MARLWYWEAALTVQLRVTALLYESPGPLPGTVPGVLSVSVSLELHGCRLFAFPLSGAGGVVVFLLLTYQLCCMMESHCEVAFQLQTKPSGQGAVPTASA